MTARIVWLLLIVLPAVCSAQSIVVPNGNATLEANTFSVWPYSTLASTYQLYLYRSQMNAWSTGVQITGIAFRINGGESTYMTDLNYSSYEVTVSESSAASFAALQLASTTFADNIGPNAVVTRSGPMHIVPGTLIGGSQPIPFAYTIDFTTPYSYTSGTDIVITIRHTAGGTPAPDARLDAGTEAPGVSWGLFSSGAAAVTGQHGNAAVVRLVTVPTPDISVSRAGGIADGGSDVANTSYAATPLDLTYTITNQGDDDLDLTGPNPVSFTNALNCAVTVQQPASLVVAPAGQTTFDVTVTPAAIGPWSVELSIDSNDPDESPFDFTLSGTAASGAEIEVLRGTLDIADNGVDAVTRKGTKTYEVTYTIRSTGNQDLTLTGVGSAVVTSGATNCSVTVTQPAQTTIPPAGETTFTLRVTPASTGLHQLSVSIANNDADEDPFNFLFQGTAEAEDGKSSDGGGGCAPSSGLGSSFALIALFGMIVMTLRRRRLN